MYRSLSLRTKLFLPTVLMCLMAIVIGGVGFFSLNRVEAEFGGVTREKIPDIETADQMYLAFRETRIQLRTLGLSGLSAAEQVKAVEGTKQAIAKFEAAAATYEKNPMSAKERELYDHMKKEWALFAKLGGEALALHAAGGEANQRKLLEIFLKDCPEHAAAFNAAVQALSDFHHDEAMELAARADLTASRANQTIVWSMFLGICAALVVAYLSIQNLLREITAVNHTLGDEANAVASVATQITETSERLAANSTRQAAAIQETTAAMEETSAMVAKTAENANLSRQIAQESQQSALRGKDSMREVLGSIEAIAKASDAMANQATSTNRELGEVVKMIQEIGDKTKVINDIVFQTKLLSFNASVEAARAGEFGKGFAVVAEEVGKLAQMSGNSAKEITTLLSQSTERVEKMVTETKTRVDGLLVASTEKVGEGTATALRCEEVLNEIVTNVERVSGLVAEIATASAEQARGVSEVNKAIAELDQAAQQNSQGSQEGTASARELGTQVENVRHSIQSLERLVKGGTGLELPDPAGSVAPVHALHRTPAREELAA